MFKAASYGKNYHGPVEEVLENTPGVDKAILDLGYVALPLLPSALH